MTKRILLAENDPIECMQMKELLTRHHYLVVAEATNGVSAVHLARTLRPDLILMEVHLPDQDGIVAAQMLTQEKIAPVVLLTACSDHKLLQRAKAAGVVTSLVKPLRECEITAVVEIALAHAQAVRALEERVQTLSEQLELHKLMERAKGLLMEHQGLSEQEALRTIRQASMNHRTSLQEVAKAILSTHEMEIRQGASREAASPLPSAMPRRRALPQGRRPLPTLLARRTLHVTDGAPATSLLYRPPVKGNEY